METPSLAALWPELLALVLLIGAAAFFSGSESAIVSLSRLRARTLAERGVPGSAALLRLLENRNRFLTSMLIGNTIVLLAADSLSTLIFIREGVPHAPEISTGIMVVLMLIFGEIGPKTIAVAHNEAWAAKLAPLLERITWVMTPLNSAFLFVTGGIVRLFGVSNAQIGPFITEEDIRNIVDVGAEQNVLEEEEREMIHSIIEFGDTIVREVMKPRPDMVTVEVHAPARRALDLVIAEGYSKLPVFEDTIDNVIGVVHDRELLIALSNGALAATPIRALMRPITHVPETKRISELLREMQRGKFSLAVVVDEYGGTAGLVTMEDLLEEIVGEIRDEHDEGEEEAIHIVDSDEAIVQAGTNIEDVNAKLGTQLPHEEFETIGGLAVGLFGRLPLEGEEISADDHASLRIERTRGRRILAVRILTNGKAHPAADEPKDGESARVAS
jgi:CBS domain containing-hemolysin-like protein